MRRPSFSGMECWAPSPAYDERRLSVRFADGSEVVASRAGSQLLREMVR